MSKSTVYPSLSQRSVFITGGGSGIGAAIVEGFCAQGAQVAFLDIDRDAANALVERIETNMHNAPLFLEGDLRDIERLKAAIGEAVAAHGPITVLVNNAAHDERHAIDDVTVEYWDDRMAVNLRHHFFAAQAVHAAMAKAGGGAIINIGSVTWLVGQGGMPGYSAAKAAIAGLTRSLARDLGPGNIRVNSILPGWIMTDRQVDLWLNEESERELMTRQCLKRKLYPEDIARVALFMASDDASACTNQNYIVDGGWV